MTLALKIIIWISSVITALLLVTWGYLHVSDESDRSYTRQELVNSYTVHRKVIRDAIDYYESIVPDRKEVEIEFEDGDISRMIVKAGTAIQPTYTYAWDSEKVRIDSLATSLGWNKLVLEQLQDKLDAADCISIQNGEPAVLGFKRSGMGMYSFNVFKKSIPDSLREQYNRGCTHIIQTEELVLEYGGGAIGPQCFPKDY